MFGKNSGPVEVQFVAQQNARRHQDKYPLAAETALRSTYMDSSIDSQETAQEGIQLHQKTEQTVGPGLRHAAQEMDIEFSARLKLAKLK